MEEGHGEMGMNHPGLCQHLVEVQNQKMLQVIITRGVGAMMKGNPRGCGKPPKSHCVVWRRVFQHSLSKGKLKLLGISSVFCATLL